MKAGCLQLLEMGKGKPRSNNSLATTSQTETLLPGYLKATSTGVLISVHAKPGAKLSSVTLSDDTVDISIDAPPHDGEANAAICQYVASIMGVRKAAVSLAAGGKSRSKLVAVEGVGAEEAIGKLKSASE